MTDIYRVKSGQSLSIIARDVLDDIERWPEIAFLNNLSHPYFIFPGQILELPPENGSDIVEVDLPLSTMTIRGAPVVKEAGFALSPATVILLAIGAFFLFTNK